MLLVAGTAVGSPLQGVVAAGAACVLGFGWAQELRGRRWQAMFVATLGMVLAAFAGCLAGDAVPLFAVVAIGFAGGGAAFAPYDGAMWWTALETLIAFLVVGHDHHDLHTALVRFSVVVIGGTMQIAIAVAVAGADVVATDEHRIVATVLGGVAAIGFALLVPHALRLRAGRRSPRMP